MLEIVSFGYEIERNFTLEPETLVAVAKTLSHNDDG